MKKCTTCLALIMLAFSTGMFLPGNAPTDDRDFAAEEVMYKRERIQQVGIPKDCMDSLSDQEARQLYEVFEGKEIRYVGSVSNAADVNDVAALAYGTIPAEDLLLTIHFFEDRGSESSPDGEIHGMIAQAQFHWKKEPFFDFTTDSLSLSWDGDIWLMESFNYSSSLVSNGRSGGAFEAYDAAAAVADGEVRWYARLLDDFTGYLHGGATIILVPKTKLYTVDNMQVQFRYSHLIGEAALKAGDGNAFHSGVR